MEGETAELWVPFSEVLVDELCFLCTVGGSAVERPGCWTVDGVPRQHVYELLIPPCPLVKELGRW